LLVMSQLPIFVAPDPPVAVLDELDEPQAASAVAMTAALISPRERFKRMRVVSFQRRRDRAMRARHGEQAGPQRRWSQGYSALIALRSDAEPLPETPAIRWRHD
jgi:hypothetical protein